MKETKNLEPNVYHYNSLLYVLGKKKQFDFVISTIAPDFFFKKDFGELKFIGRDFHRIVLPMEKCFPGNTFFIYFANSEQVTRIVEYKQFTQHKSKNTLYHNIFGTCFKMVYLFIYEFRIYNKYELHPIYAIRRFD